MVTIGARNEDEREKNTLTLDISVLPKGTESANIPKLILGVNLNILHSSCNEQN